jgi:hypothetical protein
MQSGTVKPLSQASGADFMLQGTINSLVDELDSTRAVFYQVELELLDLASNVKVWQGQKRVKKLVEPNKTTPGVRQGARSAPVVCPQAGARG